MKEMSSQKKRSVLVAEDIRAVAVRIRHVLQGNDYAVEIVDDGVACVEALEVSKPDLLFLDLMLPKMNGIDVLKAIRSKPELADLPVIVCTAKGFSSDVRSLLDLGVMDVIIKPFDNDTILAKVENCFLQIKQTSGGASAVEIPSGKSKEAAKKVFSESPVPSLMDEKLYDPELRVDRPRITLWGTRGSIPVSGVEYVRHGGNTTCMEYSNGKDAILFDAGSGLREAAVELVKRGPRHVHLFITHTHWDHINGFPFFLPMYLPDYQITVYGERGFGTDFEALLKGQFNRDYFPAEIRDLKAKVTFRMLDDEPVQIGNVTVSRTFTNHPGATVGYRIEEGSKTAAFIPDNEFLQGYVGHPGKVERGGELAIHLDAFLNFFDGVDLMVHEAQYLPAEYQLKKGWGHTSVTNGCALAKLLRVKKWIVTHHDPVHSDDYLDRKLQITKQVLGDIGCGTEVQHAYDRMVEFL